MTRPLMASAVVLCLFSPVPANVVGPRDRSALDRSGPVALTKVFPVTDARQTSARGERDEFQLTEDTEVLLDGHPCKYKDVPANVSIIRLELGPDKTTILKIHFKTRK
jgi:hypothetical protein